MSKIKKWSSIILCLTMVVMILSGCFSDDPKPNESSFKNIDLYAEINDNPNLDEFDKLRLKWKIMLTGGSSIDPSHPALAAKIAEIDKLALSNWETMNKSEGRTKLWEVENKLDVRKMLDNFTRIETMATAFSTKGSSLENNEQLREDIIAALEWLYKNQYSEKIAESGNWWHWQIGVPLALHNIVIMLYDELTPEQRDNYMKAVRYYLPAPNRTGANLVWTSTIVAVNGVIVKDDEKIRLGIAAISPVYDYVTSGDGFYEDGSFIQHGKFPYTGGYGIPLLQHLSNFVYLLNDSKWSIEDPDLNNMYSWIADSFEPVMYKGAMMDMVRGRSISRPEGQDHKAGHDAIEGMIRVSQFAPEPQAAAMKSAIKHWITEDTFRDFLSYAPMEMIILADQIKNDGQVKTRGDLQLNKPFPSMDRVVHHRSGFSFGISMHSSRIFNYESINTENLKGWHTADGMTYLYNDDLAQFNEDFWPTVNSYRLPGTTVLKDSSIPHKTTIDSSSKGNNKLTVNGSDSSTKLGWSETLKDVEWVHLEGNTADSAIGYYFPRKSTLDALREERTGNWYEINDINGSQDPITRNYFTLWFDHGDNPSDQTYEYVLLPNKTALEVEKYSSNSDIEIVVNNENVHAVKENKLGILAANFWNGGMADYIEADNPAAVMIRETNGQWKVAVSDPTQAQEKIVIEIQKQVTEFIEKDSTIEVLQLAPTLKLEINVSESVGKSHHLEFKTF